MSGGNSGVESLPSKQMVAGSNPVPRSTGLGWFAYALRSKRDGWLYVGMSCNVERRLREHNAGYNRSTRSRRPFEIIYLEQWDSRQKARERERFLKTGKGREFLRSQFAGN